ncbi:MAG: type II secretion system protein [Verrucomicrobiales bacterium]|nr:type II secretion system protein [Verrucomicrobiales bacterium]
MLRPWSNQLACRRAVAGSPSRGGGSGRRGFTLVEIIAVLALIAILSVVVAPVLIRVFDRLAREAEEKRMAGLIEGLRTHVLRNRNVPFTNNFAAALAQEMGLDADNVSTNARGLRRVYLVDPAITNTIPIPFTQNWVGVTNNLPALLGVMLISSISRDLPTNVVSGFAPSSAAFSNAWYTVDDALPAGWNWEGDPEDLVMERMNLRDLFVEVTLNYDTWTISFTNRGRFTIDNSTTNRLPGFSTVFTTHYLASTMLGLHSHTGISDTLQVSEILRDPAAYVYEIDTWRGRLFTGRGVRLLGGIDLQAAHDLFLAAPWNVNAKGNPAVTQRMVVDAMADYMVEYLAWASAGFPSKSKDIIDAKKELDTAVTYLIFKPNNEDK